MSKIGSWLIEMTEYANESTREEFVKKYGEANVDIWEQQDAINELEEKENDKRAE